MINFGQKSKKKEAKSELVIGPRQNLAKITQDALENVLFLFLLFIFRFLSNQVFIIIKITFLS